MLSRYHCIAAFLVSFVISSSAWAQSRAIDVYVDTVAAQILETRIEALGTVKANESVSITSNVTKTIESLHFNDGQQVKTGDLLVKLSSNEEEALLAEAQFNFQEATKQRERIQALVKRQAASESLLDQQIREQDAAGARVSALQARLKDLRIVAPFDGVIGLRGLSVGSLVTPGTEITTLNDERQMKLDFTVPAVYLRQINKGTLVKARSLDIKGEVYHGKIASLNNQIDTLARAVMVRAILPNKEKLLMQGMLMKIDILAQPRETILISEAALVPIGNKNYVFVVKENVEQVYVTRQEITIAQRIQGAVEVEQGLTVGDVIVIDGVQKLRDGQQVNPLKDALRGRNNSLSLSAP